MLVFILRLVWFIKDSVLTLNLSSNQHAPIYSIGRNIFSHPRELEKAVWQQLIHHRSQIGGEGGIPYGIVHCGICKK